MIKIASYAIESALQRINARWTLRGMQQLSRRAWRLRVETGDSSLRQLVALTHNQRDRERNPEIASDEYRLLKTLQGAGLPVAKPLGLAPEHEPPFLITSHVEGAPRFDVEDKLAYSRQLASTLSAVHAFDIGRHHLAFLPRLADVLALDIDARGRGDERTRAALRAARPGIRLNEVVLLHGDFWPGNLLWVGDQLRGVIDWEDAMLGDPLADLGKSRLEIFWALGDEAMQHYTAHYLLLRGTLDTGALPFWDLWGALRLAHFADFARDTDAAERMQAQYDGFVAAALNALQK